MMNKSDYNKTSDEVDEFLSRQEKQHRGIGIPKKLFVGLIASLIIVGIASAGILTMFMAMEVDVSVDSTNVLIDDSTSPYSKTSSFSNKLPGDTWNESIWVNNTKSGTYYLINLSATSDDGLSISFMNSTDDIISTLNATTNHLLFIQYELDLLCEPDTYNATIELTPLEAGRYV